MRRNITHIKQPCKRNFSYNRKPSLKKPKNISSKDFMEFKKFLNLGQKIERIKSSRKPLKIKEKEFVKLLQKKRIMIDVNSIIIKRCLMGDNRISEQWPHWRVIQLAYLWKNEPSKSEVVRKMNLAAVIFKDSKFFLDYNIINSWASRIGIRRTIGRRFS